MVLLREKMDVDLDGAYSHVEIQKSDKELTST